MNKLQIIDMVKDAGNANFDQITECIEKRSLAVSPYVSGTKEVIVYFGAFFASIN